jgi:L-threonylcarbamoyladenylate synthase
MPELSLAGQAWRSEDLQVAVDWLKAGRVVALPTDTFYGFAADPTSPAAVRGIFEIKGRGPREALPLVAASTAQVERCCGRLGRAEARLASRFWPGPLALVLDAPRQFAPEVHGGRGTVAIRVPAHAFARAVCEAWGGPLTATSANRTGAPPARASRDLAAFMNDARVLVIDAGASPGGLPSTIVDARGRSPTLVRAGAIDWERVLESLNG